MTGYSVFQAMQVLTITTDEQRLQDRIIKRLQKQAAHG